MQNDTGVTNNGGEVFCNGRVEQGKAVQVLERKFDEVKGILERNRIIIQEIEHNQAAREAGGLSRNVALIRELNGNTAYVRNLYSELSNAFSRGLAKAPPAASAEPANKRARVGEYHFDLSTSSSGSLAKASSTDTDATKEG